MLVEDDVAVVVAAVARTDKSKHADQHEAKVAKQWPWFLLDLSVPGHLLGDAAHSGGGPFPSLILSGNGIKDLPQSVVSGLTLDLMRLAIKINLTASFCEMLKPIK